MDILEVRKQLKIKTIYDIPLRVTFYARVSTDKDEQLNSLDSVARFDTADLGRMNADSFG